MRRPLVFDLFHTLLDGADDERDRMIGEMAVAIEVPPLALVAAYHASWRERLVGWGVEETIRVLARRLGHDPTDAQVSRAATLRRSFARRTLDTATDATLTVLDRLRAEGHRLALLSNATAESAAAWPRSRLASRFDVVVFSCEVGLAKPDPEIYRRTAARLGVEPAACVFVGDGADGELDGAEAAGMTALRTTEHKDTDPSWNGPVIGGLGDLPALLGGAGGGRAAGEPVGSGGH
ncbi:HAD family hydrolase [Micromonospora musae]|uniref:HAD family hydrolase n=1 Tax=Micromonospora musae TaxID=1894970 RepID=A0ABX9REY1_9ACTN|nr:HAD-IA family hydrolase [Micromonospora musae]RKN21260.1 HAD family hydrolase [Micromonospora musae]